MKDHNNNLEIRRHGNKNNTERILKITQYLLLFILILIISIKIKII
jgi:hypothetical protein